MDPFTHHKETGVSLSLPCALRLFGYLLLQYGEEDFLWRGGFWANQAQKQEAYEKFWQEFKELNLEINFEEGPPGEEAIVNFFRHLRTEKKVALSSIWTLYSYINSILKRKYGFKLQELFQQARHLRHGKQAWEVWGSLWRPLGGGALFWRRILKCTYAMAGIELVPVPDTVPVQDTIESTIGHGFCAYCEWNHCEF